MTYKDKAINLIMEQLGVNNWNEAEEIVEAIDKYCMYKPCVIGKLNAPMDVKDFDEEIREYHLGEDTTNRLSKRQENAFEST